MSDDWQMDLSGTIPRRYRSARLGDLDAALAGRLRQWAITAPIPSNLVLCGAVGTGKTYAAVAALHVIAERMTVGFLPIGEMLERRYLDGREDDLSPCSPGVLLLDDLGAGYTRQWDDERVFLVINRRWMEQLPTIVTTNLSPTDLEAKLGERTFSRLGDGAVVESLTGPDRRLS